MTILGVSILPGQKNDPLFGPGFRCFCAWHLHIAELMQRDRNSDDISNPNAGVLYSCSIFYLLFIGFPGKQ